MTDPLAAAGIAASLESVLSTGELNARPSRPPDYEAENRALVAIAQHMADSPRTTLQKLVEVALEVCHAGSAGISLISRETGDFYWPAIAGAWKPYISGGTPRHFGPCAVVVDRDAVQLFTRPERYYPYLVPVSPPIAEALLTPFHVEGKPIGTVWVIAHDTTRKFDAEDLRLIESLGRFAAAAHPLWAALDSQERQTRSLREINEALLVSSVRQHELTEQAEKAEAALRESEERLELELAATQSLQETSTQLLGEDEIGALYEKILDAAVAIMRSEYASIQILYPERGPGGELRLLSHRGFDPQSVRFWEWVGPTSETSCGAALRTGQRIIVSDVETCDFMAGSEDRAVFLQAGIHAAQSTPLVSRTGKLLGMISTHWRQPHQPSERDLRLMDVLARMAADLIERSQAEKALQNLNTDLKHFSYAASHDLQEPLRMVTIYTQLLSRQYKGRLDPQADQFIAHAVDGAQRMEILLRDLREYWSVNEQKIEKLIPVDCNRLLEKTLSLLDLSIQESGAVVTHDFLPIVVAEELPLTLLFQNLIANAIKYRRPEAPPRIHLSAERREAAWQISVTDNGIGIEPEHLEIIFAPFKRLSGREYPGAGLGLAICQRIVERYRGTIWVESTYGKGSTFHATLPTQAGDI